MYMYSFSNTLSSYPRALCGWRRGGGVVIYGMLAVLFIMNIKLRYLTGNMLIYTINARC